MVTIAQSAANWRNTFTHTLTSTHLQPRGAKRRLSYYLSQYAGSFRVSVIHPTTVLQDLERAYVIIIVRGYTHGGWEHQIASQHNIVYSEEQVFLVLLTRFEPSSFTGHIHSHSRNPEDDASLLSQRR